jgi:hypothetical protein
LFSSVNFILNFLNIRSIMSFLWFCYICFRSKFYEYSNNLIPFSVLFFVCVLDSPFLFAVNWYKSVIFHLIRNCMHSMWLCVKLHGFLFR